MEAGTTTAPNLHQIGVTRRFSILSLLVFTTLYAILVQLLVFLGAPAFLIIFWGILLTAIGVGQAYLFDGKKPRQASMLVGLLVFPILLVACQYIVGVFEPIELVVWQGRVVVPMAYFREQYGVLPGTLMVLVPTVVWGQFAGIAIGYVLGFFAAAVFTAGETIRQFRHGKINGQTVARQPESTQREWTTKLPTHINRFPQLRSILFSPFNARRPDIAALGAAAWLAYASLPVVVVMQVLSAPVAILYEAVFWGVLGIVVIAITWAGIGYLRLIDVVKVIGLSCLLGCLSGWQANHISFAWWGTIDRNPTVAIMSLGCVMIAVGCVTAMLVGIYGITKYRQRNRPSIKRNVAFSSCALVLLGLHIALAVTLFLIARQPMHLASREIFRRGGHIHRWKTWSSAYIRLGDEETEKETNVLALLSNIPKLTECHIDGRLNDSIIEELDCPTLTKLDLTQTQITGECFPSLAKQLPQLAKLNIFSTPVDDQSLANLDKFTLLTDLHLGSHRITDEAVPSLAKLKGLTTLTLRASSLTEEGFKQLETDLPKCKITR